jgi:hypothetical protein
VSLARSPESPKRIRRICLSVPIWVADVSVCLGFRGLGLVCWFVCLRVRSGFLCSFVCLFLRASVRSRVPAVGLVGSAVCLFVGAAFVCLCACVCVCLLVLLLFVCLCACVFVCCWFAFVRLRQ